MRRLLAIGLLPLLLASCGGGGGAAVACSEQYWDGTVGLCLPAGWSVVARETLSERGLPNEVIAAFQAEKSVSGQFPTVTVMEENLAQEVDSAAYSEASIRAVATLPGYELADSQDVTVNGETVKLHIFTAQPLNEEPARKFYQVSAVSGQKGYTFTALTPLSVSSSLEREVMRILESASFSEPNAESETSES